MRRNTAFSSKFWHFNIAISKLQTTPLYKKTHEHVSKKTTTNNNTSSDFWFTLLLTSNTINYYSSVQSTQKTTFQLQPNDTEETKSNVKKLSPDHVSNKNTTNNNPPFNFLLTPILRSETRNYHSSAQSTQETAFQLQPNYAQETKSNVKKLMFSHITSASNTESIRQHGLLTKFGGSDRGAACKLNENYQELKDDCKDKIHLGRDCEAQNEHEKSSQYYSDFLDLHNVPNNKLTVILTHEQVNKLEPDEHDDQPGRYTTTQNISPQNIFFTDLRNIIRKPGEISADGFISEEVRDAIFPDRNELLLMPDEETEYLRAAIHGNKEPLYNTLNF